MMEVLMVLQTLPEAAQRALAQRLQESCTVVSTMGPRLVVGRVPPHGLTVLRALPGVLAVVDNAADLAALPTTDALSATEQLFAAGWAAQGQKKGLRAGAGLAWDAPGFLPPDGPVR